jgi:hypothetical protein
MDPLCSSRPTTAYATGFRCVTARTLAPPARRRSHSLLHCQLCRSRVCVTPARRQLAGHVRVCSWPSRVHFLCASAPSLAHAHALAPVHLHASRARSALLLPCTPEPYHLLPLAPRLLPSRAPMPACRHPAHARLVPGLSCHTTTAAAPLGPSRACAAHHAAPSVRQPRTSGSRGPPAPHLPALRAPHPPAARTRALLGPSRGRLRCWAPMRRAPPASARPPPAHSPLLRRPTPLRRPPSPLEATPECPCGRRSGPTPGRALLRPRKEPKEAGKRKNGTWMELPVGGKKKKKIGARIR